VLVNTSFTSKRLAMVLVWLLSLVLVGGLAHARGQLSAEPEVLTGTDLGFRVARKDARRVVGHLVVRVDGRWVVAELGHQVELAAR